MAVVEDIRSRLEAAFAPVRLEITDDSHRHAGHAGAREGGETHFRVEIVAAAFAGKTRLERQRLVHACLAEALAGPVHALSVTTRTPEEDDQAPV